MKKSNLFILAVALLAFSSCSSSSKPIFTQQVYTVDYKTAGLDGKILLTESPSVSFDYESLGSIIVEQRSGYEVLSSDVKTKITKGYGDTFDSSSYYTKTTVDRTLGKYLQATPETALMAASKAAQEMGGDAIIGLKHSFIYELVGTSTNVVGYTVSGMVVKRK